MTDFDYSGYGLFESLASDHQEERRAQRKALVTAKVRIDENLGRFLKSAKSGPEFDERYALVQEEFVATIREAAHEFGARPDSIANAIFHDYREGAYKVADGQTTEDLNRPDSFHDLAEADYESGKKDAKDEDEDEDEDDSRKSAYIKEAPGKDHLPGASDKRNRQYEHIKDSYEDEGTSEDEAKELAARTVNKERSEKGETKNSAHPEFDECPKCHGSGRVGDKDCPQCDGKGAYHKEESEERESHFLGLTAADGGEKGLCSECLKEGWLKSGVCGPCRGKKLKSDDNDTDSDAHAEDVDRAVREEGLFSSVRQAEKGPEPGRVDNSTAHYRRAAPNRDECACGEPFTEAHIKAVKGEDSREARTADKWIQKATEDPDFDKGGLHRATGTPEDEKIPESKIKDLEEHGTPDEKKKAQFAENVKKGHVRWAADINDLDSYEKETVDIPPNKSDSPTGLDGPSPKIDKGDARKDGDTGWSLGDIDAPSRKHPTERIDPTVTMPRENIKTTVKEQVKGIGETVTDTQDLPSGDLMDGGGFNKSKNTGDSGPTKTWGDNGTKAVTGPSSLVSAKTAAAPCANCGTALAYAGPHGNQYCPNCHTEHDPYGRPTGAPTPQQAQPVQQDPLSLHDEPAKYASMRWAALLPRNSEFYPGQQGNSDEELAYLESEHPINYDDGSLEGDHYHGRHYDHVNPDCPLCQHAGPSWRIDHPDHYRDGDDDLDPSAPRPAPATSPRAQDDLW